MDIMDMEQEAAGPLPDGLQVVAIECQIADKSGPRYRRILDIEEVEGIHLGFFRSIGACDWVGDDETTIFGAERGVRLRMDIIASPAVLRRWVCSSDGKFTPGIFYEGFETEENGKAIEFIPCRARLLNSLKHWNDSETDHVHPDGFWTYKNQDIYDEIEIRGFKPGDLARWVAANQTTDADFERLNTLLQACDRDPAVVGRILERQQSKRKEQSFLVPGLIPRGAVTLLLGNKKVGKSAIAMELAVRVAQRESEWLGFPLNQDEMRGFAVYLSGEDSEEAVMERVSLMSDGENPMMLHIIPTDGSEIDTLLDRLKKQKIDLLIVDPARKYYKGDEDSSDATSEFFTKLEKFAREKQCAVLVLHHLKRNANPRTLADVARQYRGSSVFLDRPRVTLAMLRQGDETHFGIPAPDGVPLHNFRQSVMFSGVRRLSRDETTFRHVRSDHLRAPKEIATGVIERVLKAASRLLSEGQRVTRTGKAALFERKAPEVAGLSRASVRDAIERLVAAGKLCCDTDGALVLPVAAA